VAIGLLPRIVSWRSVYLSEGGKRTVTDVLPESWLHGGPATGSSGARRIPEHLVQTGRFGSRRIADRDFPGQDCYSSAE
jgi:hypothetical protein